MCATVASVSTLLLSPCRLRHAVANAFWNCAGCAAPVAHGPAFLFQRVFSSAFVSDFTAAAVICDATLSALSCALFFAIAIPIAPPNPAAATITPSTTGVMFFGGESSPPPLEAGGSDFSVVAVSVAGASDVGSAAGGGVGAG